MLRRHLIPALLLTPLLACAADFTVSSPDLQDGKPLTTQQVFEGFGCHGGNRSPALHWQGAPAGTQSFAVTVYDPDAPTGSGWWHWTVVNIPANITHLAAGAGNPGGTLPAGAVQGRTDYGQPGFGGACPPPGAAPHRYQFTVWALKTASLPVDGNASGALVGYLLNANALGKTTLTATYGR